MSTNVCADPLNFGELEFPNFKLDDDRPTWPTPGIAKLVVEDKYEPLFTSATWTIIATVDGMVISRSTQRSKAHSDAFIKRWTRQMIRSKYAELRQLGVDADAEYVKWGGLLDDLNP